MTNNTNNNDDGSLNAEVSSRLDELFGEDDSTDILGEQSIEGEGAKQSSATPSSMEADPGISTEMDDSPIKNLKALVFSIEWEISDQTMADFLEEVSRLKEAHQDDRMLYLFLKLHESIGKYIKIKKARAHPDSVKLVSSFYRGFEKSLLTPKITEAKKKKLLSAEVKKFKEFKQRVLAKMGDATPSGERTMEEAEAAAGKGAFTPSGIDFKTAADYIISEIKKYISAEFDSIRQIIKDQSE